jgi:microcystin-dependent protein
MGVQLAGDLSGTATTPTIATGAITSGKILDGTVANIDLAAGVGGIYKGSGSLSGATTVTQGTNALNFTGTGVTTFNSGNVGIGTTSPNAPLQFANTVANRKLVLFDGINNDHQFYGFGVNSVDVNGGIFRYQLDGTGSSHVFYAGTGSSSSNELFRILGNGNVGIGASAPSAHLTIGRNGNVANGNILLGSSTDASSKWTSIASQQFNVNGSTNNRGYSLITGVSGNANENVVSIGGSLAEQYAATSINFNTAATSTTTSGITRMTITGAGNVGIGTAAPSNSAILDLSSNTMGIAIPRMTSAQRKAIVSPTTGLQVYDTDLKGIYIFDGTWDCLNVPAGTVQYAARNTPPRGYLEANGQAVDRTTYAELFTAIGTTYGAGNGTTTFNLPDLRGEFVRGWSNGRAGVDAGRAFASSQLDDLKSHLHAVDPPATLSEVSGNHAHTAADGNALAFTGNTGTGNNGTCQGLPTTGSGFGLSWGQGYTNAAGNHSHFLDIPSFSSSSTGGTETRPRNIALLPIIKF